MTRLELDESLEALHNMKTSMESIIVFLENEAKQEEPIPVLEKVRSEVEEQEKWLAEAGYNAYNVGIAFESVKRALGK